MIKNLWVHGMQFGHTPLKDGMEFGNFYFGMQFGCNRKILCAYEIYFFTKSNKITIYYNLNIDNNIIYPTSYP
jgi:hypothetical protein